MGILLFPHNEAAYRCAVSMLAETGKAAVIHPTGTGKSFLAFKLCDTNQGTRNKVSITTNLNRPENETATHRPAMWLADCGRQISFFECWGVRIMCASKNSQIQGIYISGALFLFYTPKILKPQKNDSFFSELSLF